MKNYQKSKYRSIEEKTKIKNRLKKIEGQVRGISDMIDDDRYCGDILIQISAINSSLKSLGELLLESHLKTCVKENILKGNYSIMDEFIDLMKKVK